MVFLQLFSATSYTRSNNLQCADDKYDKFTTLREAKMACDADDNCKYVYDIDCDDDNYYLCPKSISLKPSSKASCVYEKKGDFTISNPCNEKKKSFIFVLFLRNDVISTTRYLTMILVFQKNQMFGLMMAASQMQMKLSMMLLVLIDQNHIWQECVAVQLTEELAIRLECVQVIMFLLKMLSLSALPKG